MAGLMTLLAENHTYCSDKEGCFYWSGREVSNLRPLSPEDGNLPG